MILRRSQNMYFNPINSNQLQALKGVPLASFSRRACAFILDIFIPIIICGLFILPEVLQSTKETGDLKVEINPFHGWQLLTLPLYYGLWTYFGHGQTLGKKLLKIRVISLTHEHLSLWHSIERSLGYAASFLEGGFGFLQYFIHPNRQTVHDRIAETIVIKVEKPDA